MNILDVVVSTHKTSDASGLLILAAGGAALLVLLACLVAHWLKKSSAAACACYWAIVLGGLLLLAIGSAAAGAARAETTAGRTLLSAWLAGTAVVLLARAVMAAVSYIALWSSVPEGEGAVAEVFQEVAEDLGLAESLRQPLDVRMHGFSARLAPRVFAWG